MPLEPILTVADLNRFLETDFSEVHTDGKIFEVIATGAGFATMRLDPQEKHLRPGGTVSGPTLFALADVTAYITLLAHILGLIIPSRAASCCSRSSRKHISRNGRRIDPSKWFAAERCQRANWLFSL